MAKKTKRNGIGVAEGGMGMRGKSVGIVGVALECASGRHAGDHSHSHCGKRGKGINNKSYLRVGFVGQVPCDHIHQ